jgi:hypothetical protein
LRGNAAFTMRELREEEMSVAEMSMIEVEKLKLRLRLRLF